MSKGNMLLGHARGKVGSLVFSRLNGKQITRAKAEQVKNPRSDSQNVQRAIFATVNGFASSVRDVVDHSFQSAKEGQESVNRFVSVNTKKLREAYLSGGVIDVMPKGAGLPYANAYRVSQGSLGLQNLFIGNSGGAEFFAVYSEDDWEGNVETVAQLKSCLPAFAPGCEVAVLWVFYNEEQHYHYVQKERAVFLSSFDGIPAGEDIITANGINEVYLDASKTTDNTILRLVGGTSGTKYLAASPAVQAASPSNLVACAVIVSQQVDNKWIYTTSDMLCIPDWFEPHDTAANIATYGNYSTEDKTSDLYLQQSSDTQSEATVTPLANVYRAVGSMQGNTQLGNDGSNEFITNEATIPAASTDNVRVFGYIVKEGNNIKSDDVTLVHTNEAAAANIINRNINTNGNVVDFEFYIRNSGIETTQKYVTIRVQGMDMIRVNYKRASE
jgi:hypothetical protein